MQKSFVRILNSTLFGLALTSLVGCGPKTAEEHLEQARQFVQKNDREAAVVALKNAVQLAPKSAEARFELGKLYMELRQFESAEKELNRALENGYDSAKVLPMLTQAYQQSGAYAALSKLEYAEQGLTSSERAEIAYFKMLSLVRLEKIDEAGVIIEDVTELDTNSVYKGLTAAYAQVLKQDYPAAIAAVSQLRDYSPQHPEVLKLLAQLQLSVKQPQIAADIFKDYVRLYPQDNQIQFVLAKLLVDLGKPLEAEPHIDVLLNINQQNYLLNQLKAAARMADKDYQQALSYAEKAILNGAADPSLRLLAGFAAYQLGDYSAANSHLSFIAGSLPNNHPALKLLAASQLQLGLTNEAGDVLERIEQLNQNDAPLLSKASYQLLREGYEKDARQLVDKSSSISVTAEDLTRLGLLQLSLNNLQGIVNLEEAVEKAPELENAQTTLATAYMATEQYDKAMQLAEQWKQANPNNNKAYMLMGQIYLKQQDFAAAEQQFKRAVELDASNPTPQLALVSVDLQQQNIAAASEKLERLLAASPDFVPALATHYLLQKQQGQAALGIERIKQQLAKQPDELELRLLLVRIYVAEREFGQAIGVLDGIKQTSDLPLSYWRVKGQALIGDNQRVAAEKHYDAWLANSPNNKEATIGRLLLLDNENNFSQALKLTSSFLEKRDDVQMQLLHTHFLLMNQDFAGGRAAYERIPAQSQSLPIAKGLLARLQASDKQYAEALPNAREAYQASPNYRNSALVVFILERLAQPEEAKTFLQQHIASYPGDMASRMLLAERQLGNDNAEAIQSYQLAIRNNPKNYIALNNLAYLLLQQGELQQAKSFAQQAVDIKPDEPAVLDTLAQILMAEKDYNGALKLYERAVTDQMKNEDIYLNYVEALFAAKQDVLAKRKLAQREYQQAESIQRVAALKAKYQF